tara:strand:- start:402 stop:794 length:393 start_codon:yes stop_codon:yes gene_type:complete
MKNLSTVLETLNSDSVCLPDSIVKTMLFESGLMNLVSAKGNMEKHELGYRVTTLGKRLVDSSKDDAVMHDMFTMEEYRDILLAEAELIQFVMEYRKKLGDEANKDFDWSSIEKKDDKPKIVGKIDLNNGI